jgi:fucose 4-O-acetylase-like acetyltransferase
MAQRDTTLDFIKGIGCICMVLSHAIVTASGWWAPVAFIGMYLGRMAPVIFFSVSGIVNTIQAKRYPVPYFLVFGALFGLFGLTYNALWEPHTLRHLEFDIPQLTGTTIIVTVLVTRWAKQPLWSYVALVAGLLAAHYGVVYFVHHGTVPDVTAAGGYATLFPGSNFLIVPAVFAPIPWLVFSQVGNIFYTISDRAVYWITAIIVGVTLVAMCVAAWLTFGSPAPWLLLTQQVPFWTTKWSMPVGFLLISLSAQTLVFAVLRWGKERMTHPSITYIGRNSFPFLFLHIMYLQLFYAFGRHELWLLWPGTLALTLITMVQLDRANEAWVKPRLQTVASWGVLLVLLAIGLVLPLITGVPALLQTHVIRVIGLVFAYNYKSLAAVVKGLTVPKVPAAMPAAAT